MGKSLLVWIPRLEPVRVRMGALSLLLHRKLSTLFFSSSFSGLFTKAENFLLESSNILGTASIV